MFKTNAATPENEVLAIAVAILANPQGNEEEEKAHNAPEYVPKLLIHQMNPIISMKLQHEGDQKLKNIKFSKFYFLVDKQKKNLKFT